MFFSTRFKPNHTHSVWVSTSKVVIKWFSSRKAVCRFTHQTCNHLILPSAKISLTAAAPSFTSPFSHDCAFPFPPEHARIPLVFQVWLLSHCFLAAFSVKARVNLHDYTELFILQPTPYLMQCLEGPEAHEGRGFEPRLGLYLSVCMFACSLPCLQGFPSKE